jgi:hyaluronoglucosaminidase
MVYFQTKGIVEGFYGEEWTWKQRKDVVSFAGDIGYNLYIYAPKADLMHRENWREPYGEDFCKAFSELIKTGREHGVDISMAVSPGLSLVYSDDNELEILKQKYLMFSKLGVKTVSVFLDDIPEKLVHERDMKKYDTLAHGQSDFINRLYDALKTEIKELKMILCPTPYHGETVGAYHTTLGENLYKAIEIMWTGPQVCSEKIPLKNAAMAAKAFQRNVMIWDNFPVNDSIMVPELHIGLYKGREKELYERCSGLIVNPMNQPYASLITLKNIKQYLDNPLEYCPEQALEKTIKEMYPSFWKEYLCFAQMNDISPVNTGEPEKAAEMKSLFEGYWKNGKLQELSELLKKKAGAVSAAYETITEKVDENLKKDIKDWLKEFKVYGEIFFKLSILVSEIEIVYKDEHPAEKKIFSIRTAIKETEAVLRDIVDFRTRVFGNCIRNYAFETLITCKGLLKLVDY